MREEMAQRRWLAREMEAKRGRHLVHLAKVEAEAVDPEKAKEEQSLLEALSRRKVRRAQESIMQEKLGSAGEGLGTAGAFATLDRLPRSVVR